MPADIFISYRRSDEAHARRLRALLKEQGVEAWYDEQAGAGQTWRDTTVRSLQESRIFVLLYSRAAADSAEMARELAVATYEKKLVVPVQLENIEPAGALAHELASVNWVNAWDDTDARLAELARSLAEVVSEGVTAESQVRFGRAAGSHAGARIALRVVGALLVSLAVILIAVLIRGDDAPPPPLQRTAFFGFDVSGDDAAASTVADAATSEVFQAMIAMRLDAVASSQTLGTEVTERLARARGLRARYALSGETGAADGRVTLAMRIDDTLANAPMWSASVEGDAEHTTSLSVRAAALATDVLRCMISIRSTLPEDTPVEARLPAICRAMRASSAELVQILRDARDLAPDSARLHAMLAQAQLESLASQPESARPALVAEAEAALAEAMRLDPADQAVMRARHAMAVSKRLPRAQIEAIALEGLRLTPQDAVLNAHQAGLLAGAGRLRDSMSRIALAISHDPLSGPKALRQATGFAMTGKGAAAAPAFSELSLRFPSPDLWPAWIQAAVLGGAGDPKLVLDAAPGTVSDATVECWRAIHAAFISGTAAVRRAGAERVKACAAGGALSGESALLSLAALGDADGAFAQAARLDADRLDVLYWPVARGLRADLRFAPLATRLGLVQYWRDSGTRPDFCASEFVPVCTQISAR